MSRGKIGVVALLAVGGGVAALLTVLLTVFQAGQSSSDPSQPKPTSSQPETVGEAALNATNKATDVATIEDLSNKRFYDRGIKSELTHLDPRKGGWVTEVISQGAESQLKELGDIVANAGQDLRAQDVRELLSDRFETTALRPSALREVFDDGSTRVRRPAQAPSGSPTSFKGAAGFAKALTALIPEWESVRDVHLHFHMIGVEAGAKSATTKTTFELTAKTEKGRIQQNAIWHCQWEPKGRGSYPVLSSVEIDNFEEVVVKGSSDSPFADCTEAVLAGNRSYREQLVYGVDYWRRRVDKRFGLDIVGSHGLALGDVNGDGMDDVFMAETGGLPNRLYLHQEDGTLRDISAQAGIDFLEPVHSALFVDLDNDGDQDLVMASGRYIVFLANSGNARFEKRGIHQTQSVFRSITAADYDHDSDLDLYACGYYSRIQDTVGLGRPMPYHDANNGASNILLKNNGGWNFEEATESAGLDDNNSRFSYAAAWGDYDNDGDQDLYVANDFGRNNLYHNDQGQFRDVAAKAGVEDIAAGMSVSWRDYNLDGHLDLYVGNMFSSAGNRIAYQRNYRQDRKSSRAYYQRHARGNTLFKNSGDGTFQDVSIKAGVNRGRWAWSSLFADLNNDGWDDLVVGNGFVTSRVASADL